MQFTPYILPLLVSAAILCLVSVYIWRYREHLTTKLLLVLFAAMVIWILSVIFEMLAIKLEHKLLADFGFLGIAPAPAIFLALALAYTGYTRNLRWLVYVLLGIAVITNIVIWTNSSHHLWRVNPSLDTTSGPFPIVLYDYGPYFYWVYAPANYTGFFVSFIAMIWSLVVAKSGYKQQMTMLLIAFGLVLLADGAYLLGITPIPNFNLAPVTFGLVGLITAWSMYRYQFLDLVPIARDVVLENISDIVIVLDNQNRIVDLNPAAKSQLGWTTPSIIGQPLAQLLPNNQALIDQHKGTISGSSEIKLSDGPTWYDMTISPLYQHRKHLVGKVVVLHNITARKQTEQALQEAHDQMLILRQMDIELSRSLDTDYVLERALDAAYRLTEAEHITISLADKDQFTVVAGLGDGPSGGVQWIGQQVPTKDGIIGRVMRQRKAELVKDVNSDPDYVPGVLHTQSEMAFPLIGQYRLIGMLNLETAKSERLTQENFEAMQLISTRIAVALDNAYAYSEMAQLAEDLDAFAHTVAHDLKNPLGLVMGYAGILALDFETLSDAERQSYLKIIAQGGDKMLNIINELLILASVRRLDDIKINPLNMRAIIEGALDRLPSMIEEKQAEITLPDIDSWPVSTSYAPWVEEVWTNYLSNALKYGGTPPHIEMGATPQNDGMIRFWVRDNGPGLTPEQQSQLFSQFTRLEETRAEGHGLGLSIVQRIIEKLGGEVAVESKPGQGSIFSFTLPAANDQ